jgi:hypothetical protein
MSNRACLQRTVFNNFGNTKVTFGFRFYDDYGQTYCNTMEKEDLELPDEEFFKRAHENFDDTGESIYDNALERGIYIDDKWYEFDLSGDRPKLKMGVE